MLKTFQYTNYLENTVKNLVQKVYNRLNELTRAPKINGYIAIREDGFWQYRSVAIKSLKKTATLFNEMNGKVIIEIGTGVANKKLSSMLLWAKKTSAKRIIGVDLEQKPIDETREATRQYPNVELVLADGIKYLKEFPEKIDLLLLDYWVPDTEGTMPGTSRAESYRDAYNAAKEKMNTHSMILIDDTDHIHPWKHTYIVPLARQDGYKVIYTGRQTLLKR